MKPQRECVLFSDWLYDIKDKPTKAIIRARISRLRLGNFGYCKPVGEGVLELKIDFGPGYRIYMGQIGKLRILLLCAGSKKSQDSDIERAKKYFEDYKKRGKHAKK